MEPPDRPDHAGVGGLGSDDPASSEPDAPQVPRRELRDPRELRALAHPLRLSLLEELASLGEATATELAERVGESPANCSWHLRQLARYGFIEEAGGGTGRSRPWRWVPEVQRIVESEDEAPDVRIARDATVGLMFDRDTQAFKAWHANQDAAPERWRRASFSGRGMNWLTSDELAALSADLEQVVERHLIARLVRVMAWGFPAGRPEELPDDHGEDGQGDGAVADGIDNSGDDRIEGGPNDQGEASS
jgi:DNA-binding transcriptional ArsR family regulator